MDNKFRFDFVGKQLEIGDSVVLIAPNYRSLALGKIKAFTKQKVRVSYTNNWNFCLGCEYEILQDSKQLVKI